MKSAAFVEHGTLGAAGDFPWDRRLLRGDGVSLQEPGLSESLRILRILPRGGEDLFKVYLQASCNNYFRNCGFQNS